MFGLVLAAGLASAEPPEPLSIRMDEAPASFRYKRRPDVSWPVGVIPTMPGSARCIMIVVIDEKGMPEEVTWRADKGGCSLPLQREAVRGVMKARWSPYKVDGEAIRVRLAIGITFNNDDVNGNEWASRVQALHGPLDVTSDDCVVQFVAQRNGGLADLRSNRLPECMALPVRFPPHTTPAGTCVVTFHTDFYTTSDVAAAECEPGVRAFAVEYVRTTQWSAYDEDQRYTVTITVPPRGD